MTDEKRETSHSRRAFLRGAAATGAGALVAGQASAGAEPDKLITEIQPWAQELGDGVDAVPYGLPIKYEADVIRRNVPWLTADTISSVNFMWIRIPLKPGRGFSTVSHLRSFPNFRSERCRQVRSVCSAAATATRFSFAA